MEGLADEVFRWGSEAHFLAGLIEPLPVPFDGVGQAAAG